MIISLVLLVLAVFVNTTLVWVKKKNIWHGYTHNMHAILITPVWLLFVGSLIFVPQSPIWSFDSGVLAAAAGVAMVVVGIWLFYKVIKLLGIGSLTNKNLFDTEFKTISSRLFYLRHPMYVSYALVIASLALLTGVLDYFLIAGVALCFLFIEGEVESP